MEVLKITPRGYCHVLEVAFRIVKRVGVKTHIRVHILYMLVHKSYISV